MSLGELDGDGVFTAYREGGEVALVWGFQGGTMVTPAISLDGTLASGDEPVLDVTLENIDARTQQPWAFAPRMTRLLTFARRDGRLVSASLMNQLGINDLAGQPIRLRLTVESARGPLQTEVTVTLRSAGPAPRGGCSLAPQYCDALADPSDDAAARD